MVWWILVAFFSYIIKGLCGFADVLVMSTALTFQSDNRLITPVCTLLTLPSNLLMTWKEREHIRLRLCLPVIVINLMGDLVGTFLLIRLNAGIIKVIFGFVVIFLGIETLVNSRSAEPKHASPAVLGLLGMVSGVLSGLFGVGALLSAYFSRVTEDTHSFKANMCATFLITAVFRITLYSLTGIITPDSLKMALILLPFMILGVSTGMLAARCVPEQKAKKLVVLCLILSGIGLVAVNLAAL